MINKEFCRQEKDKGVQHYQTSVARTVIGTSLRRRAKKLKKYE